MTVPGHQQHIALEPTGTAAAGDFAAGDIESKFHRKRPFCCTFSVFEEIKTFSEELRHLPVIDPNKRRSNKPELAPVQKGRHYERPTVERSNSDLKDNYEASSAVCKKTPLK